MEMISPFLSLLFVFLFIYLFAFQLWWSSRYEKGAYMFGRVDICDFVLEHPTISRFHAGIYSFFSCFLVMVEKRKKLNECMLLDSLSFYFILMLPLKGFQKEIFIMRLVIAMGNWVVILVYLFFEYGLIMVMIWHGLTRCFCCWRMQNFSDIFNRT